METSRDTPFKVTNRYFIEAITQVNSLIAYPLGLFALIADPKEVVVVVTETINSKEKIKLRWSMLNLENNNRNTTFITNDKKFNSRTLLQRRFRLLLEN